MIAADFETETEYIQGCGVFDESSRGWQLPILPLNPALEDYLRSFAGFDLNGFAGKWKAARIHTRKYYDTWTPNAELCCLTYYQELGGA